jgi:predicted TIM-barrel fold metal-dependent hydrolase
MRIVDFHSHFFSAPFFQALADNSPLPGTPAERLQAVLTKTGIEAPNADIDEHRKRWLGELDEHGVDHMVSFASLPEEIEAVGRAAERSDGRLTAMALVNPLAPGAAEKTSTLLANGAFGGVMSFPAAFHFDLSGDEARALYAAVDARGGIVYLHCGMLVVKLKDLFGYPRPNDLRFANPLALIPAANAFPELAFVIPHFGAGMLRETLIAGAQCANIHVDTSSSNSWIQTQPGAPSLRDVFARALDVFGPERILFGTDSNVFPAGWRADRLEQQQAVLAGLRLSDEEQALVLGGNARRLLARKARR